MAALYLLSGSAELLGPAGLYAADTLGRHLPLALDASLGLWVPLAFGARGNNRQALVSVRRDE